MTTSAVTMKQVNKWYGKFHVLRDINLDVAAGERIVICGPRAPANQHSFAASIGWKNTSRAISSLKACPSQQT
jgi:ABC-type arginine transport system ATPase subunit